MFLTLLRMHSSTNRVSLILGKINKTISNMSHRKIWQATLLPRFNNSQFLLLLRSSNSSLQAWEAYRVLQVSLLLGAVPQLQPHSILLQQQEVLCLSQKRSRLNWVTLLWVQQQPQLQLKRKRMKMLIHAMESRKNSSSMSMILAQTSAFARPSN